MVGSGTSALVTGAAGFIGQGAAAELERRGLTGRVLRFDRDPIAGYPEAILGDVVEIGRVVPAGLAPDVIVHCAGITTSACEADPDAAFRINVEGTRALIAWCRTLPRPPRLVFTSSVAVFGGGAATVDEESRVAPRSTYGAVKAAAEHLVLDASRRGDIDGVVVRLPITIVRTQRVGKPGAGYLSDLIIQAVEGRSFVAPLAEDHAVPVASSRLTFELLAALAETKTLPPERVIHVPSIAATGREALAVLRSEGLNPRAEFIPEPAIARVITGWPRQLVSRHAAAFGIAAPASLEEIVADYRAWLGARAGAGL